MSEYQEGIKVNSGEQNHSGFIGRPELSDQIRYCLNVNDVLKDFECLLKGVRYDPQTKKWIRISEPIMNKEGAGLLILFLGPELSRNFSLSDQDGELIVNEVLVFGENMAEYIVKKKEKYGINAEMIPLVVNLLCDSILANLNKSKNGGFQKFLTNTSSSSETRVIQPSRQGGILNIFRREPQVEGV